MSVQDYYAELQKGMIRAGVQEETEDKICHFYSGLHTEIQDTVDYKEYNIVNHLFQLAILVKKELQGRQVRKMKMFFMLHSAPMNSYTFWSSFLNDTFGFPCSFHFVDTFYNSTPRYRPK
jgi:hypothetical protein